MRLAIDLSTSWRTIGYLCLAIGVSTAAGCAAQRAEGPLAIRLGLSPEETARALRSYDFCRSGEPTAAEEIFPQCDRPGVGFGDAWVVANYQDGRLVRVGRYERWASQPRAQERWSQLVGRRNSATPSSSSARDQIFARQRIPVGTQSWNAFATGETLVGVYLLQPGNVEDPSVLEEILPAQAPATTP